MSRKNILIIFMVFTLFGCIHSSSGSKEKNSNEVNQEQNVEFKHIKQRCSIDIVWETDESIDNLSDTLIYLFLYSFDESCNNNVEYCEYSNEVLFKLLVQYPEKLAINLLKEGINQEIIFNELSSPINDAINTDQVVKSVKNANIDDALKNKIIAALITD